MQAQTAAYPKIMIHVCDLGSVALNFNFTTASSRAPWHSENTYSAQLLATFLPLFARFRFCR